MWGLGIFFFLAKKMCMLCEDKKFNQWFDLHEFCVYLPIETAN